MARIDPTRPGQFESGEAWAARVLGDRTDTKGARRFILGMARRELDLVWHSLGGQSPEAIRDALTAATVDIARRYGPAIAELARADFMEVRYFETGAYGPVARLAEVKAPVVEAVAVEISTRAEIGSLWDRELTRRTFQDMRALDRATSARSGAARAMERHILNTGRGMTAALTDADPGAIGYRRRLTGDTNCGFCVTMAGRPTLYGSRDSALSSKVADKYHTGCDCVAEPVYNLDRWRADPERRALEARYEEAAAIPGVSSMDDIAYAIRARGKGRSPDEITKYLRGRRSR